MKENKETKNKRVEIRMSEDEFEKLNYLVERTEQTKTEVIIEALNRYHKIEKLRDVNR